MRFSFFIFTFLLGGLSTINAQVSIEQNDRLIAIAEQYISANDANVDFDTYLENLEYYALHPININAADRDELESIGVLNEVDIQKILDYKGRLGSFVEVNEMILAGLERRKVESIAFLFTIKNVPVADVFKNGNFKKELSHQIFLRYQRTLEEKEGYKGDNPKYLGDPNKYYMRYAVNYRKQFQAGFVLEKDDGEQFYQGNNQAKWYQPWAGFDYSNAYLSFKTKSIFKTTVVGSYSLHLGQGLISWSGLGMGKSVFALESKKIGEQLKPYTSVNESSFYKGIASQIKVKKWTVIPYLSHKKIDANVVQYEDTTETNPERISSIQKTGYHRTEGEIKDKNAIQETIAGVSLGREVKHLELRANYQWVKYSAFLEPRSQRYQQYNFSNDHLHAGSIDYRYNYKKLSVFGEHAYQSENKSAHLVGAILRLHSKLDMISIYRNYSAGYYTPYSNGFGEGSTTANEKGLYVGFELKPKKDWILNAYVDYYKRPWLTYNTSAPSHGVDVQLQLDRKVNKYFDYYFRLKHELKQINATGENTIRKLTDQAKWRFRYHLNFEPYRRVKLKTRIEFSGQEVEDKREIGTLIYQDVKFSLFRYKLDVSTRIAYFNTPSFNTAIYAYENEVLYFFSIPAYYNQGVRYYILTSFKLSKNIQVWLRYSRWVYTDVDSVSSGNAEIMGDTKSEFKVQMRLLF